MAMIHDVMPVFELFQPTTVDDTSRCSRSTRRMRGCSPAAWTPSIGSRTATSAARWSSISAASTSSEA